MAIPMQRLTGNTCHKINESYQKNIHEFLQSSGIYVASLIIKHGNLSEICDACTCKTGKIIYLSIFDSRQTKKKLESMGFRP